MNDSTLVFHLSKEKNWTLLLRTTGPACPAKTSSTLTLFTPPPHPHPPVHLRIASASHADVWDWKLSHGRYIIHFLLELSGPVRHLRQTFDRLRGKPVLLSLYRRFILYPYAFPLIFITKKCPQGDTRAQPFKRQWHSHADQQEEHWKRKEPRFHQSLHDTHTACYVC